MRNTYCYVRVVKIKRSIEVEVEVGTGRQHGPITYIPEKSKMTDDTSEVLRTPLLAIGIHSLFHIYCETLQIFFPKGICRLLGLYSSLHATRRDKPETQIPASDHWLSREGALHYDLDQLPPGLDYTILNTTTMYPPSMGYGLDIEAISGILGSISIACWVVVFSPQIIENYSKKSADGLSIEFIIIWLGEQHCRLCVLALKS
jgi:hypothetical protein